jgi:hypothetical protein
MNTRNHRHLPQRHAVAGTALLSLLLLAACGGGDVQNEAVTDSPAIANEAAAGEGGDAAGGDTLKKVRNPVTRGDGGGDVVNVAEP